MSDLEKESRKLKRIKKLLRIPDSDSEEFSSYCSDDTEPILSPTEFTNENTVPGTECPIQNTFPVTECPIQNTFPATECPTVNTNPSVDMVSDFESESLDKAQSTVCKKKQHVQRKSPRVIKRRKVSILFFFVL